MCRCVWSRNLKNEEAMARAGPQRHKKKKNPLYLSVKIQIPESNVYTTWHSLRNSLSNFNPSFVVKFMLMVKPDALEH